MEIKPIFITVIAFDKLDLDNVVLEQYCRKKVSEFENTKQSDISLLIHLIFIWELAFE